MLYGKNKRKINENLKWYNVEYLNISKFKDIISISTKEFKNDYISFLIKQKKDQFSFYYFRILLKKSKELILPLDSNIRNNCNLIKNHCFFLLKNDYNIFSLSLTIFTSEKNKYFSIYSKDIDNLYTFDFNYYIEMSQSFNYSYFLNRDNNYINIENDNNKEYVFLSIFIEEGIINNILSTFYDVKKEISPNIYSSKIYKLDNNEKSVHLSLKNNFKISFCSFYGEGRVNWNDYFQDQIFSQNMLGKYYEIPIKDNNTDINFQDEENFIIYIKLRNIGGDKRFSLGKTLNDFIKNENFPLYYFFYLEKRDNEDIDINFKIINLNDEIEGNDTKFEIEGDLINMYEYEQIKSKGKQFSNSIKGDYDVSTKIGFLNFPFKVINKTRNHDDQKNIILIKISGISDYNNTDIFIQIFAIKKTFNITIPTNQYIIKTYEPNRESPEFKINYNSGNIIIIELHRNSKDIGISSSNINGIKNENNGIIEYSLNTNELNAFDQININLDLKKALHHMINIC